MFWHLCHYPSRLCTNRMWAAVIISSWTTRQRCAQAALPVCLEWAIAWVCVWGGGKQAPTCCMTFLFFRFYQQTLEFLFLPTCQEKKPKIAGLCSSLCTSSLRGAPSKYGAAGPALTHRHSWLGLFNPLPVPLKARSFSDACDSEWRDFMLLPSFPRRLERVHFSLLK